MPITSISIDQFQKISSGRYNAGEVKLSDKGSLTKVNNHVHLRGKNVETVTHEETLAVKETFVRALANSGVGTDELNAVRRELGLLPDGSKDKALAERSVKPLTRQQIREILDRNAAAINASQGKRTIVTDSQLHSGSRAEARAQTRDAVNAELGSLHKMPGSCSLAMTKRFIGGDIAFDSEEERKALLESARYTKDVLLSRYHDLARDYKTLHDPNGTIDVFYHSSSPTCDDIYTATLELGTSIADFMDKLDDEIIQLTYGGQPFEEELDVRTEFKSLQGPERDAWLAQMTRDPAANGQKARIVAVLLLQEHSVDDYESLSLVNRIDDANAVMLAISLSKADPGLKGAALLQDGNVRPFADMAASRPFNAPLDTAATIPGISTKAYNESIFTALCFGAAELPTSFSDMAYGARQEVSNRFGTFGLTTPVDLQRSSPLDGLVGQDDLQRLIPHDDGDTPRVTAASIRDGYLKAALEMGAKRVLVNFAYNYASNCGMTLPNPYSFAESMLARSPGLLDRIVACHSPDDLNAISSELAANPQFHAEMMRSCAVEVCMGSVESLVQQALAGELGLDASEVSQAQGVNTETIPSLSLKLKNDILSGEVKASTPDEVAAAFRKMATDFAHERAEALRSIDARQVSPELRTALRTIALQMPTLDAFDLDAIFAAADKADFSQVVSLANAKAEPSETLSALSKFFDAVSEDAHAIAYADGKQGVSSGSITNLIGLIAIDRTPGGNKAIEAMLGNADLMSAAEKTEFEDKFHSATDMSSLSFILSSREGSPAVKQIELHKIERSFLDGAGRMQAGQHGYFQSEFPMLARTYALCVASGMSEPDARSAALDPGSGPRRLMRYGGRFAGSAESFGKGLKLQTMFADWFAKACDATVRNDPDPDLYVHPLMTAADALTLERFAFEEIAFNNSLTLDPASPSEVFSATRNPAMKFITHISNHALAYAVLQIQPQMRGLIYETYNAVEPLHGRGWSDEGLQTYRDLFIARAIANYSNLASLRDAGGLLRDNIVSLLFPETSGLITATDAQLRSALEIAWRDFDKQGNLVAGPESYDSRQVFDDAAKSKERAYKRMARACASQLGLVNALSSGMMLPDFAISSSMYYDQAGMRTLGNPAECERMAMKDLVCNPTKPVWSANWQEAIPETSNHFVFKFAEGTYNCAPRPDQPNYIGQVADAVANQIEELCRPIHQEQIANVFSALSSNGGEPLRNYFIMQGISTDSRCPLVQTITRDEATGTVNIVHSNPPGFPFSFSWTTSVAVDGSTTTSMMSVGPGQAA